MTQWQSESLILTWSRYEEDVEQPQVVSLVDSYNVMPQSGRNRGHKGERGPMGPRVSQLHMVGNNIVMLGASGKVYPRTNWTPRTPGSPRPSCGVSEVTRGHRGSGGLWWNRRRPVWV